MAYFVPLLFLTLTLVGFFAVSRGQWKEFPRLQGLLRVVVALPLIFSAVLLHFLHPTMTASIIPPSFPAPMALVMVSGVCELAGAVGLFIPAFRKPAALGLGLLLIAVFPANIYAADKVFRFAHEDMRMPGVPLRLAMQMVYMLMVLLSGYGVPGKRSN